MSPTELINTTLLRGGDAFPYLFHVDGWLGLFAESRSGLPNWIYRLQILEGNPISIGFPKGEELGAVN